MSMSRKDYKAIAAAITAHTRIDDSKSILKEDLIRELQEYFKQDNMAFDAEKFREACYAEQDSELIRN